MATILNEFWEFISAVLKENLITTYNEKDLKEWMNSRALYTALYAKVTPQKEFQIFKRVLKNVYNTFEITEQVDSEVVLVNGVEQMVPAYQPAYRDNK